MVLSFWQQCSLRMASEKKSARQASKNGAILSKYGASKGGIARMRKLKSAEDSKNQSPDVRRKTKSEAAG